MPLLKKVFALCGSPRSGFQNKKSFTERVLDLFLEGMEPAECKKFYPHKMKISYCRACLTCWFKTPGKCALNDDMQILKPEIEESDVIILASPVHSDGFSAPVKTVLDRCFAMLDPYIVTDEQGHCRHKRLKPKLQSAVLVSTCGFSELDNFEQIRSHFTKLCKNFGWTNAGQILIPAGGLGFMRNTYHEKYLAVKQAGKEFAHTGTISPQTMQAISAEMIDAEKYKEIMNSFFSKIMYK